MDLETFYTELYVIVDDCYKEHIARKVRKHAGAQARLSDSEGLACFSIVAWAALVTPWHRSFVSTGQAF
jgi:hypothetical protein